MGRRLVATTLVLLLSGISLPGQAPSLGMVTQSSDARLNSGAVSVGTTVFDGDRLETAEKGALSLRSGPIQLFLRENSAVLMGHDEAGLFPTLERGSVNFRTEGGVGFRLVTADVRARPLSSAATVGEVTLEKCAVVVTSRTQALEVTAGTETKIVEEGKSYRVLIEGACRDSRNNNQRPVFPSHSRFLAIPVAIGIIGVIAIKDALQSPDRP